LYPGCVDLSESLQEHDADGREAGVWLAVSFGEDRGVSKCIRRRTPMKRNITAKHVRYSSRLEEADEKSEATY
jgi:hypothetical protein